MFDLEQIEVYDNNTGRYLATYTVYDDYVQCYNGFSGYKDITLERFKRTMYWLTNDTSNIVMLSHVKYRGNIDITFCW